MNITIKPEFQKLIPPLHPSELEQLEANIIRDGCRDPLVVWSGRGILLDGHNRHAICERHNIEFRTVEIELEDESSATNWIILNQLGRRNLSPDAAQQLLGRLYLSRRKEHGGDRRSEEVKSSCQNDNLITRTAERTAEQIAKETGVSPRTVIRAGEYVQASDKLGISDAIVAGKIDVPRSAVIEVAKTLPEKPTPAQVEEAKAKLPHVANNSGNNEWYTPPEFIQAARDVMGEIDLDPASSEVANETVGADRFFTEEDNGLSKPWSGRVWMNPPYAQPLCSQFCERVSKAYADSEIESAIVLVNNATETRWFQGMLEKASAVCFLLGRVKFLRPEGLAGAPLQGQAILYFGEHGERFLEVFSQFGKVMFPR